MKDVVGMKLFYFALSRTKQEVYIFIDNQRELINKINARTSEKKNALEKNIQKETGVEYEYSYKIVDNS